MLQAINGMPYENWHGKIPDVLHIRVFGSESYCYVSKIHQEKLDTKTKKTILIGYDGDSKNYHLYNKLTKKISTCRYVTFNEKKTNSTKKSSSLSMRTSGVEDIVENAVMDGEPEAKYDYKIIDNENTELVKEDESKNRVNNGRLERYEDHLTEYQEPNTSKEVTTAIDIKDLRCAINEELQAYEQIVPLLY